MSQVWFFDYSQDKSALRGVQTLFGTSGFEDMIPKSGSTAIKLHMGELGNIRYIRPIFACKVADIVRSRGGKPFLFDTVSAYPTERDTKHKYLSTAAKNGFVEASVNAPVVITDDDDKQELILIRNPINDCQLSQVEVPSLLVESACLLVLSHVKGHDLAGFGGAVKNLGMGCVSTKTKRAQHLSILPQFDEAACDGCGICADKCLADAIMMVNDRPERETRKCISCGMCVIKCPSGGWVWPSGSKEQFQVYLAHAASAVFSGYQGRIGFMNFIQDVVPHCDCMAASGRPVVQDVGIMFSLDPVAIDKASLDLIDQAPLVPGSTPATPPDLLGKMHGTSSLVQLTTAEKLGIGTLKYEMVSV